jgi:hypothetical protein
VSVGFQDAATLPLGCFEACNESVSEAEDDQLTQVYELEIENFSSTVLIL